MGRKRHASTRRDIEGFTLQDPPPCETNSEETVFRAVCAAEISAYDALLEQLRTSPRGLEIEWKADPKLHIWGNHFGAGHTLPVIYRLHALCFKLRRRCHIRLYDTDYDEYFRYANGEGWGLSDRAAKYPSRTERLVLTVPQGRAFQQAKPVI